MRIMPRFTRRNLKRGGLHIQLANFLRLKQGTLSPTQYARRLKISPQTLRGIYSGKTKLRLRTLEKIMTRLNCGLKDIFPPSRSTRP